MKRNKLSGSTLRHLEKIELGQPRKRSKRQPGPAVHTRSDFQRRGRRL